MKYFIIIMEFKENTPDQNILNKVMPEHLIYFKETLSLGKLLVSGPNSANNGGVIIMKANNINEIEKFMALEPLTVNEFTSYKIVEFEAMDYLPILKE